MIPLLAASSRSSHPIPVAIMARHWRFGAESISDGFTGTTVEITIVASLIRSATWDGVVRWYSVNLWGNISFGAGQWTASR